MSRDRTTLPSTRRRTKIVCTLGPSSNSPDMIDALIHAGMNVVRINCSHGTRERHATTIDNVRSVAGELGVYIPVMLDLSGPKMRIGGIAEGSAVLKTGDEFTLTTRSVPGDWREVEIKYPALVEDVGAGDRIIMGDGEIELRVRSTTKSDIVCEVINGGELRARKGINAPGVSLRENVPTEKDLRDVAFGVEKGVDWVAQSFVRNVEEVRRLREAITSAGGDIPIVVKVEKREALDDLDAILTESNGVMIARGDLGLDMPIEQVPLIQKDITARALRAARPVITATQMLESMIHNPRPTRAEAADIANAVFDGTDAVMLSAETAVGKHPVAAVRTMAEIAVASETRTDYAKRFTRARLRSGLSIPEAIAHTACFTSVEIDASVIICCTRSGQTALYVSNNRPPAKIAVVSPHPETLHRTMLYWHTHPIRIDLELDTDAMIAAAKEAVLESGIAQKGDRVVIVAGVPVDVPGTTNMVKADTL